MEKLTIRVVRNQTLEEMKTSNIVILYNVSGISILQYAGQDKMMKKDDIVVINPYESFSCVPQEESVFVLFQLNDEFLEGNQDQVYQLMCDSTLEDGSDYETLRDTLKKLMVTFFDRDKYTEIKVNRMYCDLMLFLLERFSFEVIRDVKDKKEQLITYVEKNYQNDLSLKNASQDFFMDAQYFSKYFKKHVGQSYYSYVVDVRLKHALDLLEHTDNKILQIAMSTGFPNLSSFNRYFKDKYEISPNDYRNQNKTKESVTKSNEDLEFVIQQLEMEVDSVSNEEVVFDGKNIREFKPYWNQMLNFGDPNFLDDARTREQLKKLREELNHEYIRLHLEQDAYGDNPTSFQTREAHRFDFLVELGYSIWISIDCRSVKKVGGIVKYVSEFLAFFSNRYSINRVRDWIVELDYNCGFNEEQCEYLFKVYNAIQSVLSSFGLKKKLMGFGISLGNREGMQRLYQYMEKNNIVIESQTFIKDAFTYYVNSNGDMMTKQDKTDVLDGLQTIQKMNPYYKKTVKETYIVAMRDSFRQNNIMNDSCYKGSDVMKQYIRCFGKVNGMSADIVLDSIVQQRKTNSMLFGGMGIVSVDGIKKPSYLAQQMFTRIPNNYIGHNENVFVCSNEYGNYHILCHNSKPLGHKYYLSENELNMDALDEYFDDLSSLTMDIIIKNIDNGTYIAKMRKVSRNFGSVQDNYLSMTEGKDIYIHPNDVEFLKEVSVPQITLQEVEVADGILRLHVDLEANAFLYIHVIRKF